MKLGHKQQRIFNIIREKGFVTFDDFSNVFNLNRDKTINKIKEFIAMNWIEQIVGTEMPKKYKKKNVEKK